MKKMTLLALPLLFASVAHARPSTYNMSCDTAKDLVNSSRGIVMNYAYSEKAGHLYKMFYANSQSCQMQGHMDGERAYVKTTDSNSCFVGYFCVPAHHNGH
jgi:hypothetical protein